jgi:TatD DNase family protein
MFIDSHCHLDRLKLDKYENGLSDALAAAKEAQVDKLLCVCIDLEHVQDVIQIANENDNVWASVGVHPGSMEGEMPSIDRLLKLADNPNVIAIGETGLDYYYTTDHKDQQIVNFTTQLQVSKLTKKATIVHTRDAREDTLSIIKAEGDPEVGGVLHCFTENWDMAKRALDLNYYISFSGIVTFKNAVELKEVAKKLPLDRILIETDSPYLAPVPYRGKPNEPKYVPEVAKCLAELRGISVEKIAENTSKNFYKLFSHAQQANG